MMTDYTPEVILGVAAVVYNMAVVGVCGWTFVSLYKASGSWWSALSLLMLYALANSRFIRD